MDQLKYMDIIIFMLFIDRLKKYDKEFYKTMKEIFIKCVEDDKETIILKDLNLSKNQLIKLKYWFGYLGLDNINANDILNKIL